MIGIVIPTRGDRSKLLKNCLKRMDEQLIKVDHIVIVDEEPKSDEKDITYRFRKGLKELFDKGCEVAFLIEDDDWYSKDYLHVMLSRWQGAGKPQVFGLSNTTYYHINRKCYTTMNHPRRSSAFSTMVTKDVMDIDWPADNYSFLDIELWKQLKGSTFSCVDPICMGIKHGIGLCGGRGHNENFAYQNTDPDFKYLESVIGNDIEFYKNLLN